MKLNFVLVGLLFFLQGCSIHSPKKDDLTVTIDGIMYQNQPFTEQNSWYQSEKYCESLTLEGYADWRLPSRKELNNISNIKMYGAYRDNFRTFQWVQKNSHRKLTNSKEESHFIKSEFLENMPKYSSFWTSDSIPYRPKFAWFVMFHGGADRWLNKNTKLYTLCVRNAI